MTDWSRIARETIEAVHASLPADIAYPDRVKAIRAAYPFGPREMWPYRAWCKAQREYLRRHDPNAPPPPLVRQMIRQAAGGDITFHFREQEPCDEH